MAVGEENVSVRQGSHVVAAAPVFVTARGANVMPSLGQRPRIKIVQARALKARFKLSKFCFPTVGQGRAKAINESRFERFCTVTDSLPGALPRAGIDAAPSALTVR